MLKKCKEALGLELLVQVGEGVCSSQKGLQAQSLEEGALTRENEEHFTVQPGAGGGVTGACVMGGGGKMIENGVTAAYKAREPHLTHPLHS